MNLVRETLNQGTVEQTRTGIKAKSVFGKTIEFNFNNNKFPLLTTKFVPIRLIASELEFFIKGITDKRWLQQRNNHIWDDWANPKVIKEKYSFEINELENTLNKSYRDYLQDKEIIDTPRLQYLYKNLSPYYILENDIWKQKQLLSEEDQGKTVEIIRKITQYIERDLGPVYGFQWRHFGADYTTYKENYTNKGYDQLDYVIESLQNEPSSRRMIISSWNPVVKKEMALEPCHYTIQLNVSGKKLNLLWSQRSIDLMLGLPFNIASYGLLLKLLSLESGYIPGKIVGMLGNLHIYENHLEGAKEQVERIPKELPELIIPSFSTIKEWKSENIELKNYKYYPSIKFSIAV